MALTDVSQILFDGMTAALKTCASKNGKEQPLFWLLNAHTIEIDHSRSGKYSVPAELEADVGEFLKLSSAYWNDIRYSSLEPVTKLWGTIVNGLRVAADTNASAAQKSAFHFGTDALVGFFQAARAHMEVADQLYHAFKAMPAPECQALAALLNVHVDAPLEAGTMLRLVRLVDTEGPMTPEETEDLNSLANTHLVDAAFRGLRRDA